MNNEKIDGLKSRREFFKEAAKAALPVLGAVILANLPSKMLASTDCGVYGCNGGCKGACESNCASGCDGGCQGGCYYSCSGSCQGGCTSGCDGTCSGSCQYTCARGATRL